MKINRSTLALLFVCAASALQANVFTVTNTADSGAGSLRQAIIDANAMTDTDTIDFNIAGAGVKTISPLSPLPATTSPVTIDGYSQPGAAENTSANGFNGTLLIELDGTNAGVGSVGLDLSGGSSTVRGFVINRFDVNGIAVHSDDNVIEGNFVGTNAVGTAALGNGSQGIHVDTAVGTLIGGTTPAARNVISGNGEGVEIRGVCDANVIQGNFIGTNATGTDSLGNLDNGVRIVNGPANTVVGGTVAGARNIISGNQGTGVVITSATATNSLVQGNYIGTDVTGTVALGNIFNGIEVTDAPNNTVGGTEVGAGNLISGNQLDGIFVSGTSAANNRIQGNLIGTDVSGSSGLGNGQVGVYLFAAPNNTIGGTATGTRNVISANGSTGLTLDQSGGSNLVQGNFIGTDLTGTVALGNGDVGVIITDAGTNTIGGSSAAAANVISGNTDDGIFISGASELTTILGNLIGTQANGIDPLGNGGDGIDLSSSNPVSHILIGGTSGNTIAFNGARGVFVSGGTGNLILSNSIFSNTGLGIDIGDDGVTPNDTGDGDAGPNSLQNFPVLTSATLGGGQITIEGNFNSVANSTFGLEFFASAAADPSGNGEGQTFLGSQDVTTDGSGNAAISVVFPLLPPSGQAVISATATNQFNSTSEFSNTVVAPVTAGQLLNISTRLGVLTGDNVLIGGFIILGPGPKQVIVRAIGPSLGNFGVPDFLADPILELHHPDGSVVTNDNWQDTQPTEIAATGLAPSEELESAIVELLDPGAYTAIVRGVAGGTGVGLVEAYDLAAATGTTANISTRGFVDTGDNVMIGGFIAGSGGGGDSTVLVRAIGPSLLGQGVPGALTDPVLELHDGSGTTLKTNDDWKDTQQPEIEETGLQPSDDHESAILATLVPGAYTAIVRGADNTTGVGLVEVYDLQ